MFLCLYVGSGGGQQVPKGLEDEAMEANESKALFEKRRERARKRDKDGKRKSIKGKDWILKKKEVRSVISFSLACTYHLPRSYTDNEGRRVYPMTPSILVGNGNLYSEGLPCTIMSAVPEIVSSGFPLPL